MWWARRKVPVALYVDSSEASIVKPSSVWWARRDLNPQGLFSQRILSPPRIPIPPLAQKVPVALFVDADRSVVVQWRRRPELNRRKRFCRPLRNHSATAPCRRTGLL